MTHESALMWGVSLILIPTIVYGGLTILGVLTNGAYGAPAPQSLSPAQTALYRAGHAHAGVLTLLELLIQQALDFAVIRPCLVWPLRIAALAVPLCVSGGFFAMAHVPRLRALLYAGALLLVIVSLFTGVGLIRFANGVVP
jgi:hypothetical protein